jgi:predicted small lipoprotein YifL
MNCPRILLTSVVGLALGACGQLGPLYLPKNSPPKQGYLLADKPVPAATPEAAAVSPEDKTKLKAVSVPTPTAPFPPQPIEPRSPISTQNP